MSSIQFRKQFRWDSRYYTLKEFEKSYAKRLPRIISVRQGWCSSCTNYTYAADDMYFVKRLVEQPRLVVKDIRGRYLSIPFDYPVKFQVVDKGQGKETVGPPQTLGDIMQEHNNSMKGVTWLKLEKDKKVIFHVGTEEANTALSGLMKVVEIYRERFLLVHSIINEKIHRYQVSMPVYVDIDLYVSVGLVDDNEGRYDIMMENAMKIITTDLDPLVLEDEIFNPEIMLFRDEGSEEDAYDYIQPEGVLALVGSPGERLNTALTSDEMEQRKKRIADGRRKRQHRDFMARDMDHLVDIGLPVPRPIPEIPPAHFDTDESAPTPVFKEKLPEGPPPPIPKRQPTGIRKGSVRGSPSHRPVPAPKPQVAASLSRPGWNKLEKLPLPVAEDSEEDYIKITKTKSSRSLSDSGPDKSKDPTLEQEAKVIPEPPNIKRSVSDPPCTTAQSYEDVSVHTTIEKRISIRKEPDGVENLPLAKTGEGTGPLNIKTWDEVPVDTSLVKNRSDFNACLKLLSLGKLIPVFQANMIDGELLQDLDETILREDLSLTGLEAKKLMKFARGWRPDLS